MGNHLSFVRTRPNHWGREEPEQGEEVGSAYFSSFTATRQQRAYGTCWYDCVVDEPTVDDEHIDPDPDEDWWQPNWTLALERARHLMRQVEAHGDAYDLKYVPPLLAAIEFCARPENAAKCFVRVS